MKENMMKIIDAFFNSEEIKYDQYEIFKDAESLYLRYKEFILAEKKPGQIKVFKFCEDDEYKTVRDEIVNKLLNDGYFASPTNSINYDEYFKTNKNLRAERELKINKIFFIYPNIINEAATFYFFFGGKIYIDAVFIKENMVPANEWNEFEAMVVGNSSTLFDIFGSKKEKAIINALQSQINVEDFDAESFYISRLLVEHDIILKYLKEYSSGGDISYQMVNFGCEILLASKEAYINGKYDDFLNAVTNETKAKIANNTGDVIGEYEYNDESQTNDDISNEDSINELLNIYNENPNVKKLTEMVKTMSDVSVVNFAKKVPWVIDYEKEIVLRLTDIIEKLINENQKTSDMIMESMLKRLGESGNILGEA